MSRSPLGVATRLILSLEGEQTNDRELLSSGDPDQAFGRLVERHGPMVYGVCRRILGNSADADDAFQATFLVLAKKARAGGWQDSVANWLYGVAYRTAIRSRGRAARRRFHEEQALPAVAAPPDDRVSLHELRGVLDEEIQRLPEKFRLPVLLCCLHDRTIEEAAATLGLPPTTVKGRLQMGRDALRDRLTRRGITLGAGALVAVAAGGSAAGVPPVLVQSTVSLAAAGATTGPVAALANQEIAMLFWKKVRAAACVLGVLAVAGSGVLTMTASTAAPVRPDSPVPEKHGKASAPVEKDGLEVTARPTKAVFRTGEPIEIEVTYTNRGKAAIAIALGSPSFNASRWTVTTAQNEVWLSRQDDNLREFKPVRVTVLSAGDSCVRRYPVEGEFTQAGEQPAARPAVRLLPAGEYAATTTLRLPGGRFAEPDPTPLWTGTIDPKPVTFRIGDTADEIPASKPAVKDGLAVTVRPTKFAFGPDERPVFDVAFTNTSNRMKLLTVALKDQNGTWILRPADGSAAWECKSYENPNAKYEREAPPTYRLDPEREAYAQGTVVVQRNGPNGYYKRVGGEEAQTPGRLPPGKYTAVLKWNAIETNPVAFVVADKATADRPAPVVVTEASNGKTIAAKVGQRIEVRLESAKKLEGWEAYRYRVDPAVRADRPAFHPAPNVVRSLPAARPGDLPDNGVRDGVANDDGAGVGTYVFAYTPTAAGTFKVPLDLMRLGAQPEVKQQPLKEFAVTVEVSK